MKIIKSIQLKNFKKFKELSLDFNEDMNILIGDNEAGKSSIILAIDLVLSGSKSKIETIGIDTLLNIESVNEFLKLPKKTIADLPKMFAELYFNEQNDHELNGEINSRELECDGLRLTCEPVEAYGKEINEILKQPFQNFPYEYYSIKFTTFSDSAYSGYKRPLKHIVLDSSLINNEYATREYIRSMYSFHTDVAEKNGHQNEYRLHKTIFRDEKLNTLNAKLEKYKFLIKTNSKSNLESDLIITEDDIPIDQKGKGRQCFIKTEFALKKNDIKSALDLLLLEEPENHLSHINMKKLVQKISESHKSQIFIATHSNMICSRLDLRKAIMLGKIGSKPLLLNKLTKETADFFMKAPDNNILEFILSRKVILVEGDAEFILIDALYKSVIKDSTLEKDDIHVISVGGTSFKRYMELASLLNIPTAIIRDNDKDHKKNCVENYVDYIKENIQVFYDKDDTRSTFEISIYLDNQVLLDTLWKDRRGTLSVQDYMLANKAEAALHILETKKDEITAPKYITEAIEWIRR